MSYDCFDFVLDLDFCCGTSVWIADLYVEDGVWMFSFSTSHDDGLMVGVEAFWVLARGVKEMNRINQLYFFRFNRRQAAARKRE